MASNCTKGDWKIKFPWNELSRDVWSRCLWECSGRVWMWPLGTGLGWGLHDPESLFQPWGFCDFEIFSRLFGSTSLIVWQFITYFAVFFILWFFFHCIHEGWFKRVTLKNSVVVKHPNKDKDREGNQISDKFTSHVILPELFWILCEQGCFGRRLCCNRSCAASLNI